MLGTVKHSETEEEFVIYRALYGEHGLWVRPAAMFVEPVTTVGHPFPQFQLMTEDSSPSCG